MCCVLSSLLHCSLFHSTLLVGPFPPLKWAGAPVFHLDFITLLVNTDYHFLFSFYPALLMITPFKEGDMKLLTEAENLGMEFWKKDFLKHRDANLIMNSGWVTNTHASLFSIQRKFNVPGIFLKTNIYRNDKCRLTLTYANFIECLTYKFFKHFFMMFSLAFIYEQLSIDAAIKIIISLKVVTSLYYHIWKLCHIKMFELKQILCLTEKWEIYLIVVSSVWRVVSGIAFETVP